MKLESSNRLLLVLRRMSENSRYRRYLLGGDVFMNRVKREYHKLNFVWASSVDYIHDQSSNSIFQHRGSLLHMYIL